MSAKLVKTKMLIFVSILALGSGLFIEKLLPIFRYNPWINTLILLTFLIGLIMPFFQIQRLSSDQNVWKSYKTQDSSCKEFYSSLLCPFLINVEGQFKKKFSYEEIQFIFSSLERKLNERHTVSRYIIGVLILLGLLGTFIGLTQTVGSIAASLKGMSFDGPISPEAFHQLKMGIQTPLSGMGVAFSSSIFGLVGSLILGVFDLQQSKAEKEFFDDFENKLLSLDKKSLIQEKNNGPAYILALLEQTAETLNFLENRMTQIEESHVRVSHTWQKVSETLSNYALQTRQTHDMLDTLSCMQDDFLKGFKDIHVKLKSYEELKNKEIQIFHINFEKIIEEMIEGRKQSTQELKNEIRLIVKTLSMLTEPEEDSLEEKSATI